MRLGRRGDTIVEVMLALTLLSAILFSAWAITNRSSQINLAARQRVVMVNQLKEQAEILKAQYARNKDQVVINRTFGSATAIASAATTNIPSNPCDTPRDTTSGDITPVSGFYFNAAAAVQPGAVKKLTDYDKAYVWVQLNDTSGYVDFYIRACWQASGSQQLLDNSQLIVRLNK